MDSFRHFVKVVPKVIEKVHIDNPADADLQQVITYWTHGLYVTGLPDSLSYEDAYPQIWDLIMSHEDTPPKYAGLYMPVVAMDSDRTEMMFLARADKEHGHRIRVMMRTVGENWTEIDDGPISNGHGGAFDLLRQVLAGGAPFNLMEDLGEVDTPKYDGDPID